MDLFTAKVLDIHSRCRRYNCLPFAGSMVEQPAWIMRLFDAIDRGYENAEKERLEEGERAAKAAALERHLEAKLKGKTKG